MATYERILLKSRKSAERVLKEMNDWSSIYGSVTIKNMLGSIEANDKVKLCHHRYTDAIYGWNNFELADAKIVEVYDSYSRQPWCYIDICDPHRLTIVEELGKNEEATPYEFTRNDIKPGYAVKLRNGEVRVAMPVGTQNTLILTNGHKRDWDYLSRWAMGLTRNWIDSEGTNNDDYDIMEVYGCITGTDNYNRCGELTTDHRKLLWSRVETKKMTVAEISKELGYPVEIVEG